MIQYKLVTLIVLAAMGSLAAQGPISDFECDTPGSFPTCEGWVRLNGVHTVATTAQAQAPGMPSSGTNFLEVAATGTPAAYPLGSTTPVFPFPAGSVSATSLSATVTGTQLLVDYVWGAVPGAGGGSSFFEILVVDRNTATVIAPVAFGDATTANLGGPPCNPTHGIPPSASTGLLTGVATLPPARVGTQVEIVAIAGETQQIFIAPASFLYIDNVRFGAGGTPMYPGNGTDAAITTSINGVVSSSGTLVHPIQGNDVVGLAFDSPGGTLTGQPFLSFFQIFTTGQPPAQEPVLGLYFDAQLPSVLIADGLTNPSAPLNPVLGGYQAVGSIPNFLSGFSLLVNLLSSDPLFPFNLGVADAHELQIM